MVPDIVYISSDQACSIFNRALTVINLAVFIKDSPTGTDYESDQLLCGQLLKWCRLNSTHLNCLDYLPIPCSREQSKADSILVQVAKQVNDRLNQSFQQASQQILIDSQNTYKELYVKQGLCHDHKKK